jgi:hypothetical protein
MKPLAIDLFCGLGGWTEGLLAEGYYVVGFDIEQHVYGEHRYPAQLVIQDVLTIHGKQFKDAALIVASPPCQAYSYRAMPWKRAKALPPPDNSLFDACFRIQREAIAAAGRFIPLVVENVRGAQKWVGRSRWNYGSYHLWGDVPALMPMTLKRGQKGQPDYKTSGAAGCFRDSALKNPGGLRQGRDGYTGVTPRVTNPAEHDHIKGIGKDLGEQGFNVQATERYGHMVEGANYKRTKEDKRQHIGVKRKFASAMIAKIPEALSRHIARTYYESMED